MNEIGQVHAVIHDVSDRSAWDRARVRFLVFPALIQARGKRMNRIAIVGGGPGGLMAARLLEGRFGDNCRLTLFEASQRLGGKMQSRSFDRAPVLYEAGVAECYDYSATGPDPLKALIAELQLRAVPTHSSAVVLNGTFLRDEAELGQRFGADTLRALQDFRRRAATMVPPASWHRGFGPNDNRHPWASRTCAGILEDVTDPIARRYLAITAHSDMATEPHLTSGLIGLRNVLKSVPGYGAQYSIAGGMEQLPRRLAAQLRRTQVELDAAVVRVARGDHGRYTLTIRRQDRQVIQQDFDAIVVAVPYNRLHDIEWGGERLRRAMARHLAHYDQPGHYLRISILFDRPFWRHLQAGSWIMLDAFGGCCVYDEDGSLPAAPYGVLGWLLAGAAALSACNEDQETLLARALDSLPADLSNLARRRIIEGKVHRWAGAVSGQPGGRPLLDAATAHRPEPIEHPGLVVVGDYLFDSTLNGVLRSARISTSLVADWCQGRARLGRHLLHAPRRCSTWARPAIGSPSPHALTTIRSPS
jgi:monoamine oxidase